MLNEEICKLREKLNDSILNEPDYNITYQISVELDQLIAQYYSTEMKLATQEKEKQRKHQKEQTIVAK
ncbi:MAG: aspartyl-phosphate phosphatase Spo0E family protein [Clostridia bacterium]|nr:aspartyl-phosphate phosphatase Spo0E family protein [Clostridia bacterium]MCI9412922.1 aspartyl-phosphate phosphatase Spo0E family protein [Clostridia bacterium]